MANIKRILVIQPPTPERESILILLHHLQPDIADTPEAALALLQAKTAPTRYHFIFLAGLPLPHMKDLISTLEADPLHNNADIFACVDSMADGYTLQSPVLRISISKKSATGWNISSMLTSQLRAKNIL